MTHHYQQLLFFLSIPLIFGGISGARGAIAMPAPSPLAAPIEDPLIPSAVTEEKRAFSPLEIGRIQREITLLNQSGLRHWEKQAATTPEEEQSEEDLAFEDWYRELRLLQVLPDRQAEVVRLGEIGVIAWENNRVEDSRAILARLDAIRLNDFPADKTLLIPLAEAYQQIRQADEAIALYQDYLETLEDPYKAEILRLIAQMATEWFDYDKAIKAYLQIESLDALNIGDREQFATLYKKAGNLAAALDIQQQLPPLYLQDQEILKIINIYLDMAESCRKLARYDDAIRFNEFAFNLAWELKYFDAAENGLKNLAQTYLDQDNYPFAIQVYEQLLIVQKSSYNRYGMMETYETLAQLYQGKALYPEALVALQQGLAIAKELNHNISLFTQAIEAIPPQ
jgi:tetratricopeptide (TPR) repeat protein